MFRFTIRDLLWLMVVSAVGAAWCSDRRHYDIRAEARHNLTREHAERLRSSLEAAEGVNGMLVWAVANPGKPQCWQVPHPEWKLVKQPIP